MHGNRAARRIANQDGLLHTKVIQQPNEQRYLRLRAVRVLAFPGERPLGEAERRAVVGNDRAILAERLHHRMPRVQAGAKPVQQHEHRLALAQRFDMHRQAVNLDELAVGVGQCFGRESPFQRRHRHEERPDQHNGQDACQDRQPNAPNPSSHTPASSFRPLFCQKNAPARVNATSPKVIQVGMATAATAACLIAMPANAHRITAA